MLILCEVCFPGGSLPIVGNSSVMVFGRNAILLKKHAKPKKLSLLTQQAKGKQIDSTAVNSDPKACGDEGQAAFSSIFSSALGARERMDRS